MKKNKSVSFSDEITIHSIENHDRKSRWIFLAINRLRFERRISLVAPVLERVLQPQHRRKIYAFQQKKHK